MHACMHACLYTYVPTYTHQEQPDAAHGRGRGICAFANTRLPDHQLGGAAHTHACPSPPSCDYNHSAAMSTCFTSRDDSAEHRIAPRSDGCPSLFSHHSSVSNTHIRGGPASQSDGCLIPSGCNSRNFVSTTQEACQISCKCCACPKPSFEDSCMNAHKIITCSRNQPHHDDVTCSRNQPHHDDVTCTRHQPHHDEMRHIRQDFCTKSAPSVGETVHGDLPTIPAEATQRLVAAADAFPFSSTEYLKRNSAEARAPVCDASAQERAPQCSGAEALDILQVCMLF